MRAVILALVLCPGTGLAQSQQEIDFAANILAAAQAPSFRADREHCGTIGLDQNGRLVASQARRGQSDSCTPRDPRDAVEIIASFHTHGSYHPDADSEVPSPDDILADMDEGIDGWLATPGGRLWFIDGQAGVARLICDRGCMPSDPDFRPEPAGSIRNRYTIDQLERRFGY